MASEIVFGITLALSIQMISGRCLSPALEPFTAAPISPLEVLPQAAFYNKPRFGFDIDQYSASNGGVFEVFSSSPIAPTGINVYSENVIQGSLAVAGTLPFLGTVEVDGVLPTTGTGLVQYSAGNGNAVIMNENAFGFC